MYNLFPKRKFVIFTFSREKKIKFFDRKTIAPKTKSFYERNRNKESSNELKGQP